jgi:hypothetical protein
VIAPGFLRLREFKRLLATNTLEHLELSNFGELFLNRELPAILAHAQAMGVAMSAANGANFNRVSDAALEAIVKHRLREVLCSIDGASQETYARYRVRGRFDRVIRNLEKLNALKARYRSALPRLTWQLVAFGHNEHEIVKARAMAWALKMRFSVKLSWDDGVSPVRDRALVARLSGLGVASRSEYLQRHGRDYMRHLCLQLWHGPQFNWDGTSLGCCRNYWGEFGGNLFRDGLLATANSEKMRYARRMLRGRAPARDDIPCTTCSLYRIMQERSDWLDEDEIRGTRVAAPPGLTGAGRRSGAPGGGPAGRRGRGGRTPSPRARGSARSRGGAVRRRR